MAFKELTVLLLCAFSVSSWSSEEWATVSASTPDARPWLFDKTALVKDVILNAHNQCRKNVNPPADPPLVDLEWADDLAAFAAKWGEKQQCGRPTYHSTANDTGEQWGENFGMSSSMHVSEYKTDDQLKALAEEAVGDWCDQGKNYNLEEAACARRKKCDHYRGVVWDKTTEVGCAFLVCGPAFFRTRPVGFTLVCQYRPRGIFTFCKPYNRVEGDGCTERCVDGAESEQLIQNDTLIVKLTDECIPAENPWCKIQTQELYSLDRAHYYGGQMGKKYCTHYSGYDPTFSRS